MTSATHPKQVRRASVSKKWLRPLFQEKERDPASAEAGIFHYQPRLMAVKNVRNVFG